MTLAELKAQQDAQMAQQARAQALARMAGYPDMVGPGRQSMVQPGAVAGPLTPPPAANPAPSAQELSNLPDSLSPQDITQLHQLNQLLQQKETEGN